MAAKVEPEPGCCKLYLPKKARYCRFAAVAGYDFCSHHLAARDDEVARLRATLRAEANDMD